MKRVGDRGLIDFANFTDSHGNKITIRTSSQCWPGRPPFVWIFCKKDGFRDKYESPHLTVAQAKRVIRGLQQWVHMAEKGKL